MSFEDFDIEELLAALKKRAQEDDDEDGEGTEPDEDEDQVDLFPDEPTPVETSPDMGDTENKLPPNTEDDGPTKLREAFHHVLKKRLRRDFTARRLRGARSKLRKDLDDGVVPL